MKMLIPACVALAMLTGCKDDVAKLDLPEPLELTADAAGHYCQMIILEHEGPKAQAHFGGGLQPLWFSQARDGLAYLLSPEEEAEVVVLYMNDMGKATSWAKPGIGNWIKAREAFYVIGSDAIGGMGAPEMVPFGLKEQAAEFAARHGGKVMRFDEIPIEAVLAPVEFDTSALELSQ
ncbi:MAG: nitrous oxide reductase accessory protein NosL [Rhodobacteraceae bacterium]|nr:nitrous oxide reductase accessory protein NosL [Paracoccaceae bacterium]